MGILSRLLSLRASATLTAAAMRARTSRVGAPPPIRFQLLLSLFLAACGLVVEPMRAMADEVFLFRQSETYQKDFKFYGSNANGSITWSNPSKASSNYTYEKGATYTNFSSGSDILTYVYGTNAGHTATDPAVNYSTNQLAASVLWGTNGLGDGTQRDKGFTYVDRWIGGMLITNIYEEEPWDITSTNYQATWSEPYGFWPLANWTYAITNDADTLTETYSISSVAHLSTDGTNGQALFRLTGTVIDPGGLPYWYFYYTNGWTMAGETPNASGRVFKVFDNGKTNIDVTVAMTDTNLTNCAFTVSAERVQLTGLEWKSSNTNDTNWQTGVVYALKGTTVMFRVTTNMSGVVWPPNLPLWSGDGASGANTQFSITFNTISADTNGQWITATAGNTVSNQVVVFDYEVKFRPSEGPGRFEGRAEYPTGFGVGEDVDFVAKFDPEGITTANAGGIEWTVTGMYYESSYLHDLSETNATGIKLGAFEETDSVVGIVASGASAGAARSNAFSVWRPKAVILRDMIVTNPPSSSALIDWPHVWHSSNSISCIKRAAYFLEPRTNCYSNLKVREGRGDYTFSNGSNVITDVTNLTAQITFTLTNSAGVVTFGPHTVSYDSKASHPTGVWCSVSHLPWLPGGAIQPNCWGIDTFGGRRPTWDGVVPNPADHVPVILTTQSVPIRIKFKLRSVDDFYFIENVTSRRDFYSTGRMTIEKKGSGVGSGPHTKEFTDGDSIE